MKCVAKFVVLTTLVLVTAGPSYAQPLRSTSIPSRLAEDEKRLLPEVMTAFYGSFDRAKSCWISKHEGGTYCMKPIRLDARSSSGRRMLFIVAGGQQLDEEGRPMEADPSLGVLGLIVLTPRGVNLGVVATTLYEGYEPYGGYPQRDTVSLQQLGPNTYGWLAKLFYDHSGYEHAWVRVYSVIGRSVTLLTTVTSYFSSGEASGCGTEEGQEHCSTLSVKYAFETHSSASSFYPIILRVSGIKNGRPFRGNYRLVFDKNSLIYLTPKSMPDEIKPDPFVALPEPGTLSLACKGTETFGSDKNSDRPVSMGIIVNSATRTVQFAFRHAEITDLDDARVAFRDLENGLIGTINRVTGDTQATSSGSAYSLQCKPVQRMF
jgi:hypothetical protein